MPWTTNVVIYHVTSDFNEVGSHMIAEGVPSDKSSIPILPTHLQHQHHNSPASTLSSSSLDIIISTVIVPTVYHLSVIISTITSSLQSLFLFCYYPSSVSLSDQVSHLLSHHFPSSYLISHHPPSVNLISHHPPSVYLISYNL